MLWHSSHRHDTSTTALTMAGMIWDGACIGPAMLCKQCHDICTKLNVWTNLRLWRVNRGEETHNSASVPLSCGRVTHVEEPIRDRLTTPLFTFCSLLHSWIHTTMAASSIMLLLKRWPNSSDEEIFAIIFWARDGKLLKKNKIHKNRIIWENGRSGSSY